MTSNFSWSLPVHSQQASTESFSKPLNKGLSLEFKQDLILMHCNSFGLFSKALQNCAFQLNSFRFFMLTVKIFWAELHHSKTWPQSSASLTSNMTPPFLFSNTEKSFRTTLTSSFNVCLGSRCTVSQVILPLGVLVSGRESSRWEDRISPQTKETGKMVEK